MAIIKYKRNTPVYTDVFDNVFDNFFNNDLINSASPSVNVKESTDKFTLDVAAPGMKKEDFDIKVDQNLLTVCAEKEESEEEKEEQYYRKEFSYSSFSRSFQLPENIEKDKIEANYKDGVISINLPKNENAKQKAQKAIPVS